MKTLLTICFLVCSSVCCANEWVPYRIMPAPVVVPYAVVQPVPVIVPLMVPYVPVVTYESVVIEHKQWCLFKRYEIVNVPKVVYVPAKY